MFKPSMSGHITKQIIGKSNSTQKNENVEDIFFSHIVHHQTHNIWVIYKAYVSFLFLTWNYVLKTSKLILQKFIKPQLSDQMIFHFKI